MILVLTRDYKQFMTWKQSNPEKEGVMYVSGTPLLRGLILTDKDEVIRYGTFYERADRYEIVEAIQLAKFKGRKQ